MTLTPQEYRVPGRLLPGKVGPAWWDPAMLRSAAEAHVRHSFDHDMILKAWVVLLLLESHAALEEAEERITTLEERLRHEVAL